MAGCTYQYVVQRRRGQILGGATLRQPRVATEAGDGADGDDLVGVGVS